MTKVSVEEVSKHLDQDANVVFVDSRAPQVWEEADTKLPGAIRVPPDEPEKQISNVRKDAYVVTYCT
jgi:rhodanese-related sulfurtransferase